MYDFNELIGQVKLSAGAHSSPEDGMCAMEMVAWLEGLPHSDKPECTCPVIAASVRCANDNMNQAGRDRLLPYLPRIVGTVSPEHEQERGKYLAWQAIRKFAPDALTAIGLHEHAKALKEVEGFAAARAASRAAARAASRAGYVVASRIAYAAAAADCAADNAMAWAATAASEAAYSAHDADYSGIFDALEGVLAIGPQSPGFSRPVDAPIAEAKKLIAV